MPQCILLVDDDSDALAMMGLILERRDFKVLTAPSGAQALNLLARELPDLVVLDVMMPQMDGFQVCRRIKADPRTAHLPVVFLTAKSQPADQMEGFHAGADDFIEKPVHPEELVRRVQTVLERYGGAPPAAAARVISVLGVRGGVGATTLAVNLALALAAQARVILADFEAGGAAAVHLGLEAARGLGELSARPADALDQAGVEVALTPHASGLRLLAAADQPVDPERAGVILGHLLRLCDVCVFDLGFGAGPLALQLAPHSDAFVLVTDSDRIGLTQARRAVAALNDVALRAGALKPVWVNRLGAPADAVGQALRDALGREPAAVIEPASKALYRALEQGQPLVVSQPDHPVAVQIRQLAAGLMID